MTASDKTKDGGSHTPGPWSANVDYQYGPLVTSEDGTHVADYTIWPVACWDEAKANARLIAAAPDLLEALPDLSAIIAWLENGCEVIHAVTELRIHQKRIDAARSKATGDA